MGLNFYCFNQKKFPKPAVLICITRGCGNGIVACRGERGNYNAHDVVADGAPIVACRGEKEGHLPIKAAS